MPNIFDIEEELRGIAEAFDQLDGQDESPEILAAVEEYFGKLLHDRDVKVDGYCRLIADYQGQVDALNAECKRLSGQARVRANAAKRLRDRLKLFMEANAMTRLEGEYHRVTITLNGGAEPIAIAKDAEDDPHSLPERFVKQQPSIDFAEVRRALEAIEADVQEACMVRRMEIEAEYGMMPTVDDNAAIEARMAGFEEGIRVKLRAERRLNWASFVERGTHVRIR